MSVCVLGDLETRHWLLFSQLLGPTGSTFLHLLYVSLVQTWQLFYHFVTLVFRYSMMIIVTLVLHWFLVLSSVQFYPNLPIFFFRVLSCRYVYNGFHLSLTWRILSDGWQYPRTHFFLLLHSISRNPLSFFALPAFMSLHASLMKSPFLAHLASHVNKVLEWNIQTRYLFSLSSCLGLWQGKKI